MKFCFGEPEEHHSVSIEAKDLEHAIKIFKISELFPEQCVNKVYYKKKEDGNYSYEYDSHLKRNQHEFKTKNPKIFIYVDKGNNDWKKISYVSLQECVNVNFSDILPQNNLLEAPDYLKKENEETLPVVINDQALSQITSKLQLREKHDEILIKKAELEEMIYDLNRAMDVLNNELSQKRKIVYILETYLGIQEEIVQIAEGNEAPENTRLSLYQQKLYMDEEVGIWDSGKGQGLDFQEIDQFDDWVSKNYEKFTYDPLSIVVWQVRRKEKDYDNIWENVQFNKWNKATYFLIRNGSQLYRIWSNVSISNRLFPTKSEYVDFLNKERLWGEDKAKEKLKDLHENYLYGLIAIQGIIERTDILGKYLRKNGVNLLKPRKDIDQHIKFIRDAETEYWISDGQLRWSEFVKQNRKTIKLGSRVCLATRPYYFKMYDKDDNDRWRCDPYKCFTPPNRDQWYTVEASKDNSDKIYFPHETNILIRYKPGDCIGWNSLTGEDKIRKRRIPWFLYTSELINFDEITLEQADYYMKSRLDRHNYIYLLPTLHWIKKIKLKERELEDEFSKMILSKLNWEYNEENINKINKVIQWWKLKNKWKRAITIKESTATKMIFNKLKKNNK
jgi:hypothetical protein